MLLFGISSVVQTAFNVNAISIYYILELVHMNAKKIINMVK